MCDIIDLLLQKNNRLKKVESHFMIDALYI